MAPRLESTSRDPPPPASDKEERPTSIVGERERERVVRAKDYPIVGDVDKAAGEDKQPVSCYVDKSTLILEEELVRQDGKAAVEEKRLVQRNNNPCTAKMAAGEEKQPMHRHDSGTVEEELVSVITQKRSTSTVDLVPSMQGEYPFV